MKSMAPSSVFHSVISKSVKDPLLAMTLCAPNEKQDKRNLGQKGLSDNKKVDFGAMKDDG